MKLKKIASLMLAGVMAVSMLTACNNGSNGNSGNNGNNGGEPTPSASYTSTVLAETNDSTKAVLSASSNTKLDRAVAAAAANYTISGADAQKTLKIIPDNWNQVDIAENIMEGAKSYQGANAVSGWNFDPNSAEPEGTWWTMAYVSRAMTDEYITEQVADALDHWADQMVDGDEVVKDATWDYTVSVAKADSLAGDKADRSKDAVVVGLAITVTKTDVKY